MKIMKKEHLLRIIFFLAYAMTFNFFLIWLKDYMGVASSIILMIVNIAIGVVLSFGLKRSSTKTDEGFIDRILILIASGIVFIEIYLPKPLSDWIMISASFLIILPVLYYFFAKGHRKFNPGIKSSVTRTVSLCLYLSVLPIERLSGSETTFHHSLSLASGLLCTLIISKLYREAKEVNVTKIS